MQVFPLDETRKGGLLRIGSIPLRKPWAPPKHRESRNGHSRPAWDMLAWCALRKLMRIREGDESSYRPLAVSVKFTDSLGKKRKRDGNQKPETTERFSHEMTWSLPRHDTDLTHEKRNSE